jgi:hypothetical protein
MKVLGVVYYEVIKGELNRRLVYECRCDASSDDRLKGESEVCTSDFGKRVFFGIYFYMYCDYYYFSFCTRTVTNGTNRNLKSLKLIKTLKLLSCGT